MLNAIGSFNIGSFNQQDSQQAELKCRPIQETDVANKAKFEKLNCHLQVLPGTWHLAPHKYTKIMRKRLPASILYLYRPWADGQTKFGNAKSLPNTQGP